MCTSLTTACLLSAPLWTAETAERTLCLQGPNHQTRPEKKTRTEDGFLRDGNRGLSHQNRMKTRTVTDLHDLQSSRHHLRDVVLQTVHHSISEEDLVQTLLLLEPHRRPRFRKERQVGETSKTGFVLHTCPDVTTSIRCSTADTRTEDSGCLRLRKRDVSESPRICRRTHEDRGTFRV